MERKVYFLSLIGITISMVGCGKSNNENIFIEGNELDTYESEISMNISMSSEYSGAEILQSTLDVNDAAEFETDVEWINAYINMLSNDDFLCEKYALAYINEDDIPELIGNNPEAWYQVCSYTKEGTIYCEMMPYGTYSREYYFLPHESNIVATSIGENGQGRYEEYFKLDDSSLKYVMTIGKSRSQTTSENEWFYEKDGVEISENEWNSLSLLDENYINFAELEFYDKNLDYKNVFNKFICE